MTSTEKLNVKRFDNGMLNAMYNYLKAEWKIKCKKKTEFKINEKKEKMVIGKMSGKKD